MPILSIAFVLSSCANNPETLKYEMVIQKVEKAGLVSNFDGAASSTQISNLQSETSSYLENTVEKTPGLVAQRLDDCFIGLKPDYCWYADLVEISNAQTIDDLTLKYLNNTAHDSKEPCTVYKQPCTSFYNQSVAFINYPANEGPTLEAEINNPRARVVLDFVSVTINY